MKGKKLLSIALALLLVLVLVPAIATTAEASYDEYVPTTEYPESAHPYQNHSDDLQTFTWPGAKSLMITFSVDSETEHRYDYVYIYNGAGLEIARYSGDEISGLTMTIGGDAFSIRLTSDGSVQEYGYSFDSIIAEMPDQGCATQTLPAGNYPQSSHPYANSTDYWQTVTWPGATQLRITFSSDTYVEIDYDYIEVYNADYEMMACFTGSQGAGETVTVYGDTAYILLTSDESVTDYGYSVSSIVAVVHNYTNACDSSCNTCGATRTPPHAFDNSCDNACNLCGLTRSTSHIFDAWYDMNCDECGYDRQVNGGNGWQKFDGYWFYGVNGYWATGWKQIGGVWYYFDANGVMATGWVKLGNTWYYMKSSGAMATGWQKIGGVYYFFDRNGCMYENRWYQTGSTWYYLKPGGAMATGVVKIGGTYYNFNSSGVWIPGTVSGWIKEGGSWYYISGGRAATGWKQIGGSWYYFSASGVMQTGWIEVGSTWYFMRSSGAMATGWVNLEGDYYYFDRNGIQKFGWVQDGGKWYFMDREYGHMLVGWYYDEAGECWYHFANDGHMHTGWWQDGYGYWYYFNSSGQQQLGWQTIGGKTYFFRYDDGGAMATNCWVYDTSYNPTRWSFCGSDGVMVKNQWMRIDGDDYYFDAQGWCTNYYDHNYYYDYYDAPSYGSGNVVSATK